jgi:hypothetical protein
VGAADDRYPVPLSDPFSRYEERIRTLERRVDELTGARPLQHTSMTAGALTVVDPTTGDAVKAGVVRIDDEGSKYGLILVAGGAIVFEVNSIDGFRQPSLPWQSIPQKALGAGPFVVTTSATFEALYKAVGTITHKAIGMTAIILTDASTTGEVRIRHGGGTTTGIVACPAGSQVTATFRWLHGQTIGTGPHVFDLQGRRASGAGNVNVYWPEKTEMIAPSFATSDGLP